MIIYSTVNFSNHKKTAVNILKDITMNGECLMELTPSNNPDVCHISITTTRTSGILENDLIRPEEKHK